MTVVTRSRMHEYAAHVVVRRTTRSLACVRINEGSVYGCIVTTRSRHAFGFREASAEVAKAWAERIQCHAGDESCAQSLESEVEPLAVVLSLKRTGRQGRVGTRYLRLLYSFNSVLWPGCVQWY
jgi:hypothetical protein